MIDTSNLFEPALVCPDPDLKDRYSTLVGLDQHKDELLKNLSALINPFALQEWINRFYPSAESVIEIMTRRPPLIILEGDVGTGKSELATTIGDALSRKLNVGITTLPLSLSTRGQGLVGEMTKLLNEAFEQVIQLSTPLKAADGCPKGAVIMLVDEADALAQSRESNQMHHEDKAGVNAFIRGIDRIGNSRIPAAVIMCSNRMDSLDPAIKRRAALILQFRRPEKSQRREVLQKPLSELGFNENEIEKIVQLTGKTETREYGFTYSDLRQRLVPSIVFDAFPEDEVNTDNAVSITESIAATPPFTEQKVK